MSQHDTPTLGHAARLARELIDAKGPVAVDEVVAYLAGLGQDVEREELIDALVDEHGCWWLADHFLRPNQLLPGRALSHRISDAEAEGLFLEIGTDLALLTLDDSRHFRTPDGDLDEVYVGTTTRLAGAANWSLRVSAGDVVVVRWSSEGELEIDRAEHIGDSDAEVRALRAAFDSRTDDRGVVTVLEVLVAACIAETSLFRTAQPLSELLLRAGLDVCGDELASRGFDWDALRRERRRDYADDLAARHDLEIHQAEQLATLAIAALRFKLEDEGDPPVDLAACAAALRDPAVTQAFLERSTSRDGAVATDLRAFAGAVLASSSSAPAGAHLMLARAAELEGDTLMHARETDAALHNDAQFWAAYEDSAWIAADRGQARRAARALEAVSDGNDPRLLLLDAFSGPGRTAAERNDRCPCGSGRKYKACCGATNGHPLSDRARWLYEKAMWFAARPGQRAEIEDLLRKALPDADLDHLALDVLANDPSVLELALFHGGLIARFGAERSVLLPADEAQLLASWIDRRSRLLRVDNSKSDECLLFDVVTGERLTVAAPGHDESLAIGRHLVAAVLSDGQRPAMFGWITLTDSILESVRIAMAAGDTTAAVRAIVEPRWVEAEQTVSRLESQLDDRLVWLFPDAADDELEYASVEELVGYAHPELVEAIELGVNEVAIEGGHVISPTLHLAMHEVVANQILDDEPAEMWMTAVRLVGLGYEQHEVLHMLGSTVTGQRYGALFESEPYDRAQHVAELRGLPETWELAREGHPPRRPRRQHRHRGH